MSHSRSAMQRTLFGHDEPRFDAAFSRIRRTDLGQGAWLDHAPAWVSGHATLFDTLAQNTGWRAGEERMYDRIVTVPRLFAVLPLDGPGHPILEAMRLTLGRRYGQEFTRISMALYRDGRDSVAWHGDRVARKLQDALVATLSLGSARRFLVRPFGGGSSLAFSLGFGDLLVMGGTCQRTFQHCIPKVSQAGTRIAVMFRPTWQEPEQSPEQGTFGALARPAPAAD